MTSGVIPLVILPIEGEESSPTPTPTGDDHRVSGSGKMRKTDKVILFPQGNQLDCKG